MNESVLCKQHVLEVHPTWIALNPVIGCPKSCSYCFLNEHKLTRIKPISILDIQDNNNIKAIIKQLNHLDFVEYVALATRTEIFAGK